MSLHDIPLRTLAGAPAALPTGTTLLIVNVASRCGFTPQNAALEGSVVARFRTRTDPEAAEVVEAIRASLPDRVT